jgi:chlorobactene glucosyltransferase
MIDIISLYIFIVGAVLVIFSLIAILNAFTFPRLRSSVYPTCPQHGGQESVPVSVLIPARNEAAVIADTLRAWRAQTGVDFELLLLDDQSTDNTSAIARSVVNGDDRFRIISGQSLPAGWKGKPWACHQLAQQASGDILIFTDADVRWQPGTLKALLGEMHRSRADLLTVWPTQHTETWSERLVVPLMAFSVLGYLPALAVHHTPWPIFAAANGQCLTFCRAAYEKIGGHAAVKNNIVEDMGFAYAIKRAGLRLRMADGNGLIQTRMYHNWSEVRNGFAKNILAGHGNNILLLLLSTLFHLLIFFLPPALLPPAFLFPYFFLPLSLLTFNSILIRALTAAVTRQRVLDAILMPVSVALMTLIAFRALQWHYSGGPQWKGRTYPRL